MPEKPVATSFSGATELTRTSPSQFGCGCSKLGASCNWLQLLVAHLGVEKPDRTGP
jgi:hypothetical protein